MSEALKERTQRELQEYVLRMVTVGRSFSELQKELKGKGQSDEDIMDAMDAALYYYRTLAEFSPEEEMGKAYSRLNLLFMSCMKIQDYKGALAVQRELNRLLSLGGKGEPDDPIKNARIIEASINQILEA
jgi:hypothetical protein